MNLSIECEWTKQYTGSDDMPINLDVIFYYDVKGIYDPIISFAYFRGSDYWMVRESINFIKELVDAMEHNESYTAGLNEIKIAWDQEKNTWTHTHMERHGSSKFNVYLSDENKNSFIEELKKFPEIMDEYKKECHIFIMYNNETCNDSIKQ